MEYEKALKLKNPETYKILKLIYKTVLKDRGVSRTSSGLADSLAENILGFSPRIQGIRISDNHDALKIDINVNVYYGVKIPQLAWDLQTSVKETLKRVYDIEVKEINVHVQGVDM